MADNIQKLIAEAADMTLLNWLENGIEKFRGLDPNGDPIMVRECLSPAHMAQVIRRLQQLGVTSLPITGTPAGNLADAARARGIGTGSVSFQGKTIPTKAVTAPARIPPLSDAPDAATA